MALLITLPCRLLGLPPPLSLECVSNERVPTSPLRRQWICRQHTCDEEDTNSSGETSNLRLAGEETEEVVRSVEEADAAAGRGSKDMRPNRF